MIESNANHNMMSSFMQLKLLSIAESQLGKYDLCTLFVLFIIYNLVKKYHIEIKECLYPEKKRYVYHLELIYIYPGTYSSGRIEKNEINEAIFFDLQKNKNEYDIPECKLLKCNHYSDINSNENVLIYLPEHNNKSYIKFKVNKTNLYLKNITSEGREESLNTEKNKCKKVKYEYELYSYESTVKLDEYIEYCKENYKKFKNDIENKEALIYRYNGSDEGINFKKSKFTTNKTFDNLILEHKVKKNLKKSIDDFFKNPNSIYEKYGMPRKLGILLYGPPGTGKTSVIKAVINYSRQYYLSHVYDIDLSAINKKDEAMNVLMSDRLTNNIVVLEEFDQASCVKKRKNKSNKVNDMGISMNDIHKIKTMDDDLLMKELQNMNVVCGPQQSKINDFTTEDFLKIFDGVKELNKVIYIATTNNINEIDPAVLRRFEIQEELSYHSRDLVKEQLERSFDKKVPPPIVLPHNKITGCKLEQICRLSSTLEEAISEIHSMYLSFTSK